MHFENLDKEKKGGQGREREARCIDFPVQLPILMIVIQGDE